MADIIHLNSFLLLNVIYMTNIIFAVHAAIVSYVVPHCGSVIENMNSDVRTDRDAHAVSKKMAFYPFDMPPGFEFQKIYICAKSS